MWMVTLIGEDVDLGTLAALFGDRISKGPNGFQFSFDGDANSDAWQVRNEAERELRAMDGLARVIYPNHHPVGVGGVVRLEDGRRHAYVLVNTVEVRAGVAGGNAEAARLQALAAKEAEVKRALRFWGGERDARTLYNVWEIIEADAGGEKAIAAHGWATGGELDRFTASLNNQSVLGDEARHAVDQGGRPKRTMTLEQAEQLIGRLLRSWLEWKARAGP